jgi:hypothetical protein
MNLWSLNFIVHVFQWAKWEYSQVQEQEDEKTISSTTSLFF